MMAHDAVAWEHVRFKDVAVKCSTVDIFYKAIQHYFDFHPDLINDLLKVGVGLSLLLLQRLLLCLRFDSFFICSSAFNFIMFCCATMNKESFALYAPSSACHTSQHNYSLCFPLIQGITICESCLTAERLPTCLMLLLP
jgi:hypothetical protein